MPSGAHQISSEAEIEALLGEPMEFVRAKVLPELNDAMRAFIAASPLLFIATEDEQGFADVSPKGDPAGFVQVAPDGSLLIPERLGNKLTFGFRNILRNAKIGLIFVVPNQLETLRVKGTATLHADPDLLAKMGVSGKPALMLTHVTVTEAFFHCGKALIRSHLWKPDDWSAEKRSIAARQMSAAKQDEAATKMTEAALNHSYQHMLY